MSNKRAALGGMFEQLVDLGVTEFASEPLDTIVKRRLKAIWTARICPNCDADALHALDGSTRIWCGRCDWKTTYTRGTPFYEPELAPGEFLVAFILYADTPLSTVQIAGLLEPTYKTLFDAIKDMEAAFARGFSAVWERIDRRSLGQRRSMRPSNAVRASKDRTHRGTACPAAGLQWVDGRAGQVSRARN